VKTRHPGQQVAEASWMEQARGRRAFPPGRSRAGAGTPLRRGSREFAGRKGAPGPPLLWSWHILRSGPALLRARGSKAPRWCRHPIPLSRQVDPNRHENLSPAGTSPVRSDVPGALERRQPAARRRPSKCRCPGSASIAYRSFPQSILGMPRNGRGRPRWHSRDTSVP
jgi:hypothetical protein